MTSWWGCWSGVAVDHHGVEDDVRVVGICRSCRQQVGCHSVGGGNRRPTSDTGTGVPGLRGGGGDTYMQVTELWLQANGARIGVGAVVQLERLAHQELDQQFQCRFTGRPGPRQG